LIPILFVFEDGGESFSSMSYLGQPGEVVLAWAAENYRLINDGQILVSCGDNWETAGTVSAGIQSLCVI
jgi:hypothetical protein